MSTTGDSTLVPPGLSGSHRSSTVKVIHDGGLEDKLEWMPHGKVKLYTNAFIKQGNQLLLGLKKRGFGKDLYNGFGGKVEAGETPSGAALRELQEEAGISAPLLHRGTLFFVSATSEHAFHIEYFCANEYTGTITESDEMRPQWFAIDSSISDDTGSDLLPIPYDQMWEDDRYWMPLLLSDRYFIGRVDFGKDGILQKWWFGVKHEETDDQSR